MGEVYKNVNSLAIENGLLVLLDLTRFIKKIN